MKGQNIVLIKYILIDDNDGADEWLEKRKGIPLFSVLGIFKLRYDIKVVGKMEFAKYSTAFTL